MNNNTIDLVATGGKLILENSPLLRENKEQAKLGVETLAIILKEMNTYSNVNLPVMSLNLEWIKQIKIAAQACNLERVTLFPYNINGHIQLYLRMYGENRTEFCRILGLNQWSPNNLQVDNTEIDALEKMYGVVLYIKEVHST